MIMQQKTAFIRISMHIQTVKIRIPFPGVKKIDGLQT